MKLELTDRGSQEVGITQPLKRYICTADYLLPKSTENGDLDSSGCGPLSLTLCLLMVREAAVLDLAPCWEPLRCWLEFLSSL